MIVLPADSIAGDDGRAPAGGAADRAAAAAAAADADNTPPEYRSGFGAEGVKALQAFVQKGGTLVTFGAGRRSADSALRPAAAQRRRGPAVEGVLVARARRCACASTTRNPIAYGMPAEGLALFMAGSQVYEVTSTDRSQDVEIIATYVERDILQSGWLLGEQVIAKKAAAVTVKHGAGKVVLLGFRPQHRDQTHGTFKLVFNALLNGPAARPGTTTTSQRQ